MEDGVWRTIGGRRIFIKNGQSLDDAMKESGKFKKKSTDVEEKKEPKNIEEEINKLVEERSKNSKKMIEIEDNNTEQWNEKAKQIIEENSVIYASDRIKWFEENFEEYKELSEKNDKITDEITKLVQIRDNKNCEIRYNKIKDLVKSHNFYSSEIEDSIYGISLNDTNAVNKAKALIKLDSIAKQKGFEISESPYSFSTYAIPKGAEVTWDGKPKDSYRVSDHWNFESREKIHCKLSNTKEYTKKLILAKYNGETYDIIEEFEDE